MAPHRRSHPNTQSDAELIRQCLTGEAAAWQTLVARHQAFLLRVPLRYGLSPADAQDVFQNVCLKLCLHIHEIEDPSRLVGWLGSVARQESLRLLRRPTPDPLEEDALSEHARRNPEPNPEAALLEEEQLHLLRQGMAELPPDCRKLLTLLYGPEPVTYTEAAEELGWPIGSIGPRRARCLERLRKKIK